MTYYTHSGVFHADEVFGYAITKMAQVCDTFKRLTSIEDIPNNGIISDIGEQWNGEDRFDHHQGFFLRKNGFPLASAGMIWRRYGTDAIIEIIEMEDFLENIKLQGSIRHVKYKELLANIKKRVDTKVIQATDAFDADSSYEIKATCISGEVEPITISNIISMMNATNVKSEIVQNSRFKDAMQLAQKILKNAIIQSFIFFQSKEELEDIIQIYDQTIIFEKYIPFWQEIVFELYPHALFAIFPSAHPGSNYSLRAIPTLPGKRALKVQIEKPDWFNGFVHQGKWIAGHDSIHKLKELAKYNIRIKYER